MGYPTKTASFRVCATTASALRRPVDIWRRRADGCYRDKANARARVKAPPRLIATLGHKRGGENGIYVPVTSGLQFRFDLCSLISATISLPFPYRHYSLHIHFPLRSINHSASGKGALQSRVMQNASTVIRPRPSRFQPAASSPPGDARSCGKGMAKRKGTDALGKTKTMRYGFNPAQV